MIDNLKSLIIFKKMIKYKKILSKPERIETRDDLFYRCVLVIIHKDTELFNDLMIYMKSQAPSTKIDMYGAFIEREIYHNYNVEKLQKKKYRCSRSNI